MIQEVNFLDYSKFDTCTEREFFSEEFMKKIKNSLSETNSVIIRNFGVDTERYVKFNEVVGSGIYVKNKNTPPLLNFRNEINTKFLHEDLNSGNFHTDYSFQQNIPDFISLQCLIPDPKFPDLGRNYIANCEQIYNELKHVFHLSDEYLLNVKFPYTFGHNVFWLAPFALVDDKIIMKIHLGLIDTGELNQTHYIKEYKLNDLINQIAMTLSYSFVLDEGDMVCFSNKFVLHKRGECSFDVKNNKSRTLNSMRFYE